MRQRSARPVGAVMFVAAAVGLAGLGWVWTDPAQGQPAPDADSLVSAEVWAETQAVSAGKPFWLAVTLKMAPGWHVYWLNPGDSGMATRPKLTLPEGWTAGPWQFPVPVKFEQPGGYVGYGYKDEVTLLVEVTPAPGFGQGVARIGVEVEYLVCEAVCLPGVKRLSLEVVADGEGVREERRERAGELEAWRSRLPVEAEAGIHVTGSGEAVTSGGWARREVRVEVPPGLRGFEAVEVFPLTPDVMELRVISATVQDYGAVIKWEARLYAGQADVPPTVRAIVVLTAESGRRTGYWVELPLK